MSAVGSPAVVGSFISHIPISLEISGIRPKNQAPPTVSTSLRHPKTYLERTAYRQLKRWQFASDNWKVFAASNFPSETEEVTKKDDHSSLGNGSFSHDAATAVLETPTQTNEQNEAKDKFNWTKQWYPITVTGGLDKTAPHGGTVMGHPLALWWDRMSSKWQVFADKCPHRLAPLSEGSITDDGLLRCSYHGWAFKPTGECTKIPQAPSNGPQVQNSRRACATIYPSMEQQGILWFWLDLSEGPINVEAAANPPPFFPVLSDPTFKFDLSFRDLPYGYDTLIENLMDPSHVPFAHHKIQGNRDRATPLFLKVKKVDKSGFVGEGDRGPATFSPPCCFQLHIELPTKKAVGERESSPLKRLRIMILDALSLRNNNTNTEELVKKMTLLFMCVPVSPGHSRVIWSFPRNFATWLVDITPRWLTHVTNNLVLDSDMYLLHLTERRLEEEGADKWLDKCYVPTTADAFVIAFRKWLKDFAGGSPNWGGRYDGQLPPTPPKRILMDRYWSHVKQCKACSGALAAFRAFETGFQVLAIATVGLVATAAVMPISSLRPYSVPLVCMAVLSTLVSRWLSDFIYKTFHFHDYNHAVVK